jgi:outer membrane usher protein
VTGAAGFFDVPPLTPGFFLPGALWSLRPPRVLDQISIGVPLQFANGSFNLALINQQDYNGTRARIVNASFSAQLFARATVFATAYVDLGTSRNKGLAIGISIPLAPDITASTGAGRDRSGFAIATDVVKPLTQDLGSVGWRLRDLEGANRFRSASAAYRAPLGRVEASINQTGNSTYGTLQNDGALVVAGGDAFLANRIDESFAIVQTGVPDLDVYAENRPVARTNKNGKALVPTLKSYQRNKVSIDPRKLPLNATIATTQEVLTPPDRSGVMVDFGIETDVRSAVVILDEPTGRPLQAGLRGKTTNGRSFVVGYDGRAFIDGLEPANVAIVTLPDRDCRADFTYEPKVEEQVVIGPVICQ